MKFSFQNKKLADQLRSIGLSEKESLVYASLLELDTAFPVRIAEYAKLNRSTVYKILLDLSAQGLVNGFDKNRKLCYQAAKPDKLIDFARQQIQTADDRLRRTEKLLPEIEWMFARSPEHSRVRFFEGAEGVREVYQDHISQKKPYEMVGFGNVSEVQKFFPKKFLHTYIAKKAKLGITSRGIFPDTIADTDYSSVYYSHVPQKFWPVIKHVPREIFHYQSDIIMYGADKISVINYRNNSPVGIIIEDIATYSMMRLIFEMAWVGVGSFSSTEFSSTFK